MRKMSRPKGFRITILSMTNTNQSNRIVYLIPGPLHKTSVGEPFKREPKLEPLIKIIGSQSQEPIKQKVTFLIVLIEEL